MKIAGTLVLDPGSDSEVTIKLQGLAAPNDLKELPAYIGTKVKEALEKAVINDVAKLRAEVKKLTDLNDKLGKELEGLKKK